MSYLCMTCEYECGGWVGEIDDKYIFECEKLNEDCPVENYMTCNFYKERQYNF